MRIRGKSFRAPILGFDFIPLLDSGEGLPSNHIPNLWGDPNSERPEAKHRPQEQPEQDPGRRRFMFVEQRPHDDGRHGDPEGKANSKRQQGLKGRHQCVKVAQFDAFFEGIDGTENHHVLSQQQQNKASGKPGQDHGGTTEHSSQRRHDPSTGGGKSSCALKDGQAAHRHDADDHSAFCSGGPLWQLTKEEGDPTEGESNEGRVGKRSVVLDQTTDGASQADDGHGRRYGDPYRGEQASLGDVESAQLAHRFDQRSVHAGRKEHGAPRNTWDQVGQAHEHTAGNVVEHIHTGCIGCLALGSSDIEEEVDDVAV